MIIVSGQSILDLYFFARLCALGTTMWICYEIEVPISPKMNAFSML